MNYYFVYGTLKEGKANSRVLEGAKKIKDFTTAPKFTMFSLGAFPGVINGGDTAIKGEIYEVTDKEQEERLDRLEGYKKGRDNNLYNKETIDIEDGKKAFIYIFNGRATNKLITNGVW